MEKQKTTWTWASTGETQRRLLDAGSVVFQAEGYLSASVAQIVAEAESSTGSLYHHFGGKAELFTALWREHDNAHLEQVRVAVRAARASGETDPLELFCAGARAYLSGSWERRDLARIFLGSDVPPGFVDMRSESGSDWIDRNVPLLQAESATEQRMTMGVLTHIITVAAKETVNAATANEAADLADAAVSMIHRVWPVQQRG